MKNDHICIDGKTLRRSFDEAKKNSAIHMVNAWSTGISLSLGQMKSEGKKNEIKTIPKLLDLLSVKGCLVSIDAMGCQKNIAEKILSKGGDYLLALKSNHKYLRERVVETFEQSRKPGRKTFNVEDFEDKNEGRGKIGSEFDEKKVKVIDSEGQVYFLKRQYFPKDLPIKQGQAFAIEVNERVLDKIKILKK